jgi:Holliday junction resolvase RusA-like endonuclease
VIAFKQEVQKACEQAVRSLKKAVWSQHGPKAVWLLCVVRRPKGMKSGPREWFQKKPDADNYAKAFLDAAEGILFENDSQVVDLRSRKVYAATGEAPHVEARVYDCTSSFDMILW